MAKWINVKDKLPKEGTEHSYLISDGEEISYGYLDYNNSDLEDNQLYWVDEVHLLKTCCSGWPEVTYWMNLPKPPAD